ncbi:MAG: ADP-ribosyltransferase [Bacteroides sp.]|nr:ADP-ribosyltransferase [Bacteroidales bacterium]MCM1068714.1 ADP-ribosyltransferase [Prevotella sp.]MCM1354686.1 ADP-ribosyltransferase [Bacteroides sp.]MCM1403766.1 ADP-ribosyltransferase [Bacteroides sp.]MCM1443516.1 ADP-ribosyltransferase [Muribaculum sp.]
MESIQNVILTLDEAADTFDSIANKTQKKIYGEVITLVKELDTDTLGKVKQTITNLKRLTLIKAKLAALSKDKEWVAGISKFADYFSILQKQQNDYFSHAFPENTLSETAKKKHEMMKQIAVQNTMEALIGDGLKANVTNKLNDILLRAVTTNAKFATLQEELRTHLLGGDEGKGAFVRYATTYAVTALSQFTGQNNKLLTDDLGCDWFMYVGSNIETTREFCQYLTEKKYIHRSEIPAILKGEIDGHQCQIYEKTGLPYGMIAGTTADNFQVNCGGWNCRHQLVPVADAVVPAVLRAKFAKPTNTPTEPAKAPETPQNAPLDLAPYQDQLHAIDQYIADHPKSAKIKGYLANAQGAAANGNAEDLEAILAAAKKDMAKFDAAKKSVAKKKAAIEQAKQDQLSAAQAAQMEAAKDYALKQFDKYGGQVAFADLFDKLTSSVTAGDATAVYAAADEIDKLAQSISNLTELVNPTQLSSQYTYEELKQANDYVAGHIKHWKNKGKSGTQLLDAINTETTQFLNKNNPTYDVVCKAFEKKAKEINAEMEKAKFIENNATIHQYTLDHPKSQKIKNYEDKISELEFVGKHEEALQVQEQALADIKKFTAAAKSVAKKKGETTSASIKRDDKKVDTLLKFLKANESAYKSYYHSFKDIKDAIDKGNMERAARYINEALNCFDNGILRKNKLPQKVDMDYIGGEITMIPLQNQTLSKIKDKSMQVITKQYQNESDMHADSRLRSNASTQWGNLEDEEKLIITKYTQTYSYLNERLRNLPYNSSARSLAEYERDIKTLTNALSKCVTKKDMVVRRGTKDFFIRELMKNLSQVQVGDEFTDGAFLSTAVHRDKGFFDSIDLIIYVPKGSMGFYVEPASHYNDNCKAYNFGKFGSSDVDIKLWNGKDKQPVKGEQEWIGQRGSRFRVIKKEGEHIHLLMIGQLYKQP